MLRSIILGTHSKELGDDFKGHALCLRNLQENKNP
jgi:hypothetical protein